MAPASVTILAVINLFATLRHSVSRLRTRATFGRLLFKTLLVAGKFLHRLLVRFLRLRLFLALFLRLLLAGLIRAGLRLAAVHSTA